MPIANITEPTSADLARLAFSKGKRAAVSVDLEDDTQYAVCLVTLADAVTPGDYAALRAAIVAVAGIADVELLIHHRTVAEPPDECRQTARIRADVTLKDERE